jgi:[protein-PII] uridylyltransferase
MVACLKQALAEGRAAVEAGFDGTPATSRATVNGFSALTDILVSAAWHATCRWLVDPAVATRRDTGSVAVLAVGGYGRAEMAPFSDVDLLFLAADRLSDGAQAAIEAMLYVLWDLHLKVGHASRTVKECLSLGREDFTIRTALLEHRYVTGNKTAARELHRRLRADLFKGSEREFVEAKLDERAERHGRQGGQRYVVEPNVKEGKGGLRDLQTLFWIAKYIKHVEHVGDLVRVGVLRADELERFLRAEDFLMAVRCHLHLISGRAQDQLTFDMQIEVAAAMGYADRAGQRAVEQFMSAYFRHATEVGELTRIVLTGLEARHVKQAPGLVGLLRRRRKVRPPYKVVHNRLAIADEKAFLSDKLNMLRLFEEGLRTGYLIHPDAMRLVTANLQLIDADMRANPEAARLFLGLLLKHGNPDRALRRMNELGVLSAFLPEFEPIVAMMQFSMYHSYTVDEHTIQCISTLAQIERGELVEELPIASRILKEGVDRKVLYLALLLHDIGKGRDEDHSVLGAKIARKVAPRLGLKPADCDTVEWLVRYHLLMSDMAQKRDLSDPRTIRDFAKAVRTRKRLDLLTVLTVCDIRGVGPTTWNNWKAQLLRTLYGETAAALETGLEDLNRERRGDEARRALREALGDWEKAALKAEIDRHYPPYWQGMPTEVHVVFARLLKDIGDGDIRIDLIADEDRDATRACFAMADHPGIFSRLAGALALVGANVVDARTYTTRDGYATAVFWVQDNEDQPFEDSRLPRLTRMIERTLLGEVVARDALVPRDKVKKRERGFRVPTSITFDNEGSEIYTIIEVDTRDRPGLLYDLTRTLAGNNISIASAVIVTYGAQAVDTFYVKDMFGLKLHSEGKQKALERKLRQAIDQGVERALT